jgi:hypothetical protein
MKQQTTDQTRICPTCGRDLRCDGELLRCETHGLFFAYGPRLLVHAAHTAEAKGSLMPWQTLTEGKR